MVFIVSSSPFLLNAAVKQQIEQYRDADPKFVEQFLDSIYVGGLNAGVEDDSDVFLLYQKSKLRLAEGGFNLRKFYSSSRILIDRINENEAHLNANQNAKPVMEEINQSESEANPEVP